MTALSSLQNPTRRADPLRIQPHGPRQAIWAAILLILPGGCGSGKQARSAGLVRLSDDEAKGLDPQKISDLTPLRVAADQFEGLTRPRGDGPAELGRARAVRCTADELVCRFTLRTGLRFSDGQPISADTFAQGFARLTDAKTAAPNAKRFEGSERIMAEDPTTVTVTLRRPLPWLAELLAQPALAPLPIHRIAAAGDRWTSDRPLVTSGPYRLIACLAAGRPADPGAQSRLARSANYSGFADAEYDRLVAQALATIEPGAPMTFLRTAKERLLRAAPILPIYHYVGRSLVAPEVRGWQDNPMNVDPSRLLYRVPR
ncbi:ABC transporter substrate-binding protein [Sphingomonas sp. ZT3P38]|uniref:ABC transporter substrate-binding protein n=1 Tax=Parasphingomonas zepuensis TaxID=3096161 RepID=UPI002FC8A902